MERPVGFDPVKRVRVGDVEVVFRESGGGDPVVLLHGWPFTSLTPG
jgi:pimeloyl-ACP methyl ester carboxylesterase